MRTCISSLFAGVVAVYAGVVQAQDRPFIITLKSDESAEVGTVYWVSNCRSILKSFGGVDMLEGPKDVTLALQPATVQARRQNCPKPVQGAKVIMKAGTIASQQSAKLVYRVRYNTQDGSRQSTHTVSVNLYP